MLMIPSLMCADFARLGEEVDELVAAGADGFHLDIMDGSFVPNFGMGLGDVQAVCKRSPIPCDVHLMAEKSEVFIDLFADAGVKIMYVHPETERTINSTLLAIEKRGMHPGLVVDPGVTFESVEYSLPVADYVLVMTVNPGFAGQKYLDYVNPKIEQFAAAKEKYGYKLLIDGACSPEVVKHAAELGADGAILGTSSLFGKGRPYAELLKELHESC
ncbi:ribulose-phosphate 3-epimerase [Enorma phocaeensis]|uniref:ribulose-phosphate 3-epimerase n=1 Tax=Enorma phocaeensis TaxID=1871019 RepID=UPI0032080C94